MKINTENNSTKTGEVNKPAPARGTGRKESTEKNRAIDRDKNSARHKTGPQRIGLKLKEIKLRKNRNTAMDIAERRK